ncbi:extracellular serine/threonine protein kinase FAM20C-like [Hippocampus comes]|uniref:extracellular serine/threonine protein kinase FAM20C-like n=1 Tax=Hippocampus comes TaxID=109280 RepID=UPI00094EE625|nr:PREDICTED: extracellular serine/threonine protein kinase FAM20C-like [Hippocampus comes]
MMWRMRRRSRTICLSLALVFIFLHLLLMFVSLSLYHQPCDPPPLTRTPFAKHLANKSYDFTTVAVVAESTDGPRRHSPGVPLDHFQGGRIKAPIVEPLASSLAKLQALFNHPLYNAPMSAVQDEDLLLKVIPKLRSERSSQMWVSRSQESYDNAHWNSSSDSHPPWLRFHLAISRWQLYPHPDPNMESVIQQLATHRIVSSVQKTGGTQLKLVMSFPNYGQAMFKPMKQERDDETNYNLYYFSDFERHNAEIGAFHLDRILGYRRVPPVVGRQVDVVKEIKDITTDRKLARTFFNSPDYCTAIKKTAPYDKGTRLVDFIDMVILDFLMSRFKFP